MRHPNLCPHPPTSNRISVVHPRQFIRRSQPGMDHGGAVASSSRRCMKQARDSCDFLSSANFQAQPALGRSGGRHNRPLDVTMSSEESPTAPADVDLAVMDNQEIRHLAKSHRLEHSGLFRTQIVKLLRDIRVLVRRQTQQVSLTRCAMGEMLFSRHWPILQKMLKNWPPR